MCHSLKSMSRITFIIALLLFPLGLRAQSPNLAPDDLNFTRTVAEANHLIAQATLRVQDNEYVHFRYDLYPDLKRITTEDGLVYIQLNGKSWIQSKDWGKTGTPVQSDKASELDTFVGVAESPFANSIPHDQSQGETVWKLIEQTKEDDHELFTYEQSRQNPMPDGVYPRFTFAKYKHDVDGRLLLEHLSAQMRTAERVIPVEIKYDFMILVPASSVTVEKADSQKPMKLQ